MQLGIRPERIEPASPQQKGRHERMHRTLKAEATRDVSTNGGMRFHTQYVTRAPALIGEHVGLDEVADGSWAVYCSDYRLGQLNAREGHVQGVHVRTRTSR